MPARLLLDVDAQGLVRTTTWVDGGFPEAVPGEPIPLAWPLGEADLERLRWYLEDYLTAPFGVWEEQGREVVAKLRPWGEQAFASLFGRDSPARDALTRLRVGGPVEMILRSASPWVLAMPWELMWQPGRPVPLLLDGVSLNRGLTGDLGQPFAVGGERLRVLMVISRPHGADDVGYRMIARPLLDQLEAVRGHVDLVVLRPPTLERLVEVLTEARAAGEPFQVVHFDGHGVYQSRSGASGSTSMFAEMGGQGVLVFEKPAGGADRVSAEKVAQVLGDAHVPVVVLNACQSAAVGKQLEAAVATRLLLGGARSVIAMAYSVYAVAAAEFMTAFYETLFTGETVSNAIAAGRARLARNNERPSPKGPMALQDWLVPVHYLRSEVSFPQLQIGSRLSSLDAVLDQIRADASADPASSTPNSDELAARNEFVGRDGLFYDLERALASQRVVVLQGTGGSGKTELAKAFGRWWRDTGAVRDPRLVVFQSFESGVVSFGLEAVINRIGQLFGIEFALLDRDQRRAQVEALLQQERLLLIWDNFESVHSMPDPDQATPPLVAVELAELTEFLQRLAAPGGRSAVIITSRASESWLGDTPRRIEVTGLSPPDANAYADQLLSSLPGVAMRREKRAFGDLMQWLGGHPLSMRILLPRLAHTDADVVLHSLRSGGHLDMSATVGTGNDLDRNTSLVDCVAYSYRHLTTAARDKLLVLGLVREIADSNVLAAFARTDTVPDRFRAIKRQEWANALAEAAAVGLLTNRQYGLFAIHPALPGYLSAVWRAASPATYEAECAATKASLVTAYTAVAIWAANQIDNGAAGLAFAVLGVQERMFGSMLSLALGSKRWDEVHELTAALTKYWNAAGFTLQADSWTDRVITEIEKSSGSEFSFDSAAGQLWAFLSGAAANRQVDAGRLDAAEQTHSRILAMADGQTASPLRDLYRATAMHQLGIIAESRGMLDDAERWYRQSLPLFEEWGEPRDVASSLHHLGSLAQMRGELDDAERLYLRSLALREALGNRPDMARSYHQLGWLAHTRGVLSDAERWYLRSLAIKEEIGDRPGMAHAYHQLGIVAQDRGRLDDAESWYRRSLALREELGNRLEIARSYYQIGMLAHARGRLNDAERWYRRSLTIVEELGSRSDMDRNYRGLGSVAQGLGRLNDAERWYHKSLAIVDALGDRPGIAMTCTRLALLAEAQGHPDRALNWTVKCATMLDEFPHPMTYPGSQHLARLANELGMRALEDAWLSLTGQPLPTAVRDYVTNNHSNGAEG